ncbi:MAG: lytic murein transglycosylase [Nocardioides sp.]|nr:lytic murein transglycosylase [Nocardioides sp.]
MRGSRGASILLAVALVLTGCGFGEGADEPAGAASSGVEAGQDLLEERPPSAGRSGSDRDVAPVLLRALVRSPHPPRTAEAAATWLTAAERAIGDPETSPALLRAAGRVQQVVYRRVAERRRWDDDVLPRLPHALRPVARANLDSRREFLALQGNRRSDTLPAWRIVEPERARVLLRHYRAAERRFGVDWEYLAAINLVETGMGRIRGTSVAGAQGPMQFIPETWRRYGRGDINDPRDSIMAAARYLSARGFTRRGGIPRALYSYNNDNRYVRGVTDLARVMQRRPRAYLGYYHWEIYFLSSAGDVRLPVGYERTRPIRVERYLDDNPRH